MPQQVSGTHPSVLVRYNANDFLSGLDKRYTPRPVRMAQNNSPYHTNNDASPIPTNFKQHLYFDYPPRDNLPPSESAYLNQGPPSRSPTLSSPPTSSSTTGIPTNWPSHSQQHLPSGWRDDSHGYPTRNRLLRQQASRQKNFVPTQSHRQLRVKRESMSYKAETVGAGASTVASTSARTSRDDAMPSTSDFVKKLYK